LENDAPSTSSTSARSIIMLATGVPERPRTPQDSGCVSGMMPFALNVVSTGASMISASFNLYDPDRFPASEPGAGGFHAVE
jgi:hypothetical protein